MQQLLVPVSDNEEQARRIETTLEELPFDRSETRVTVLNVFKEFEVAGAEWSKIESEEFYEEDEFPAVVASVASNLESQGFTVDVRREHGDPAEIIIEVADEIDADAIVMAGRKRSRIGQVLFGSVTQGVMLSSPVPAIVAGYDDRE